jgi:curved DNA-binding protein CbpA
MEKNYYVILGVSSNATVEEVKAAFRRRVMELHPDRSGKESGPFLEVQEAYGVLSDDTQRRRYDRLARERNPPGCVERGLSRWCPKSPKARRWIHREEAAEFMTCRSWNPSSTTVRLSMNFSNDCGAISNRSAGLRPSGYRASPSR